MLKIGTFTRTWNAAPGHYSYEKSCSFVFKKTAPHALALGKLFVPGKGEDTLSLCFV